MPASLKMRLDYRPVKEKLITLLKFQWDVRREQLRYEVLYLQLVDPLIQPQAMREKYIMEYKFMHLHNYIISIQWKKGRSFIIAHW